MKTTFTVDFHLFLKEWVWLQTVPFKIDSDFTVYNSKCTVIKSATVFNYIQPFPKPVFDPYWVDYYILDKFGAGKEVDLVIVSAKFCLNLNCCWNWLSRGFKLNSRMLIQMLLRKSGVEPYLLINRNLFLFSPFRIQIWLCVIFLYDP